MSSVALEYIWQDALGGFRSKIKVVKTSKFLSLVDVPVWNFDGSSTGQALGKTSDMMLKPVYMAKCNLKNDAVKCTVPMWFVLCDVLNQDGTHYFPDRAEYYRLFEAHANERPWYGFEQEYFLYSEWDDDMPEQGSNQYYCGVTHNNSGRGVALEHMQACIDAGLNVSGINAEVERNQWEYQIGPVEGVDAAHQLLLSRFLLVRVAGYFGRKVDFTPKPQHTAVHSLNGSGCHMNFSTAAMREKGGYALINDMVQRLAPRHAEFMTVSGNGNHLRMTGANETSSFTEFSSGFTDRGASVRVPLHVATAGEDGTGAYFEDRRPGSNCDPYAVGAMILKHLFE